jgi:hypothetical protein
MNAVDLVAFRNRQLGFSSLGSDFFVAFFSSFQ